MRRFNLYCRNGIFYCRFKDEATGKWQSGISTGEGDEKAAMATVYGWERDGIPSRDGRTVESVTETRRLIDKLRTSDLSPSEAKQITDILKERGLIASATVSGAPGAEPFADFLIRFWDFEESPYVREKVSRGHSIGRYHCGRQGQNVTKYWIPAFPEISLAGVSRADLREFAISLADNGLSGQTINHILDAGTVALRWAHQNELIPSNPADGLAKYAVRHQRRGVLTPQEAAAVFQVEWSDERARIANLVAATTGLRAGEIAALQVRDVADDRLHVRHSWSDKDGLKSTKTGEERTVPLLPAIRDELRSLGTQNPNGTGPTAFVFWSANRADQPISRRYFSDRLKEALALLDVSAKDLKAAKRAKWKTAHKQEPDKKDLAAEERVDAVMAKWTERNVDFHAWRHFYAARMADRLEARQVMLATGHKTGAVFEEYANHATAEQFAEVAAAGAEAFGNIVKFPGRSA